MKVSRLNTGNGQVHLRRTHLHAATNAIDSEARRAIEVHAEQYRVHDAALLDLQRRLAIVDDKLEVSPYVKNDKSGIVHRADTISPVVVDSQRVAPCGWLYSSSRCTKLKVVPEGSSHRLMCSR